MYLFGAISRSYEKFFENYWANSNNSIWKMYHLELRDSRVISYWNELWGKFSSLKLYEICDIYEAWFITLSFLKKRVLKLELDRGFLWILLDLKLGAWRWKNKKKRKNKHNGEEGRKVSFYLTHARKRKYDMLGVHLIQHGMRYTLQSIHI